MGKSRTDNYTEQRDWKSPLRTLGQLITTHAEFSPDERGHFDGAPSDWSVRYIASQQVPRMQRLCGEVIDAMVATGAAPPTITPDPAGPPHHTAYWSILELSAQRETPPWFPGTLMMLYKSPRDYAAIFDAAIVAQPEAPPTTNGGDTRPPPTANPLTQLEKPICIADIAKLSKRQGGGCRSDKLAGIFMRAGAKMQKISGKWHVEESDALRLRPKYRKYREQNPDA